MIFIKQIKPTFELCYKNLQWIAACIGLDAAFLFLINIVFFRAYSSIIVSIDEIQKILTENFPAIGNELNQEAAIARLSQSQDILLAYYKEILVWVGIFILAGYILWVLTQSLTWFITHRINNTRAKFWRFFAFFALASLLGLLLILGAVFVSTSLLNYLAQLKMASANLKLVAYLPLIAAFIISYFIVVAYAIIPFKQPLTMFATAIKSAAKTIPVFLAGMIFLLLIHLGIVMLIKFNLLAAIAGIILALLPGISIARCYFCGAIKRIID